MMLTTTTTTTTTGATNQAPAKGSPSRKDRESTIVTGSGATKPKKTMKLSRLFKKEGSKKLMMRDGDSSACSLSSRDLSKTSATSTSTSTSTRRNSKRRQQKISQFVRDGSSSKLLWGDSGDTDNTSEESFSSFGGLPQAALEEQPIEEEEEEEVSPQQPVTKSVRFSDPLVAMCVEVESSWMIWGYPGPNSFPGMVKASKDKHMRDAGKTRAVLLDESCLHIRSSDMAGYSPKELLAAQPLQLKFLDNDELKLLRRQKERLAKYRRKLKKKKQKIRETRCQRIKEIALQAVEASKKRQERIINRYKMAAPNAVEHRRRRHIKFGLARAARAIVKVQERHKHLQDILQAAQARSERKKHEKSHVQMGLPHYHIRHQMKRIMIHQASMKALIRLQRNNLRIQEFTSEPIVYPLLPVPATTHQDDEDDDDVYLEDDENYHQSSSNTNDSEDDDDDDDDDAFLNDPNLKRLEVAVLGFLAAAKSQEFGPRRRMVEI